MKKGTYSKQPVQTQFGWHVILLEDKRQATPPSFEDVKKQLLTYERTRELQEYLQKLRKKAKIEIN
jgi:peptidyl-prolyl cis-trans isomerase C